MARGMPRHREHSERKAERRQFDDVAFAHRAGEGWDILPSRAEHIDAVLACEGRNAPDVIVVVVRNEDRREPEAMLSKGALDDLCVARIDHGSLIAVAQEPDVVIAKRGKRDNVAAAEI